MKGEFDKLIKTTMIGANVNGWCFHLKYMDA